MVNADELFECEFFEGKVEADEWIDAHCTILRVKNPEAMPEHFVIPNRIDDDYFVTEIADGAFAGLKRLRSVVISSMVENIGERAFANCENLQEVTFARDIDHFLGIGGEHDDGDMYVGDDAFAGCNAVSTVHFSNVESLCRIYFGNRRSNPAAFAENVLFGGEPIGDCLELPAKLGHSYRNTYLRSYAFCGLNIKTLKVAEGITKLEICPHAFDGCEKLTDFIRPDDLEFFDPSGLVNCNNLKCNEYGGLKYLGNAGNPYWAVVGVAREQASYKTHDDTKRICAGAFEACEAMTEFYITDGVRQIYADTFKNCVNLRSVRIPASVEGLSAGAFEGCGSLKSVELPRWMSFIGDRAFFGCKSLESVMMPEMIEWKLGQSTFENCISLKEVGTPRSYLLPDRAFAGCTALTRANIGDAAIGEEAFAGCASLTEIRFNGRLNEIRAGAFRGCTSLARVELPASVERIAAGAFEKSTNIVK